MAKIFFSYRRVDTEPITKRVYRQFLRSFGFWRWLGADRRNLFLDKDNLIPKGDFRAQIQRFIIQSDHMLVFIGKDWLAEIKRRQASGEVDFVVIEIESAFMHQVNVIPVLVQGASMPNRADLPLEISQLAMLQAHFIRDAYFEEDVAKLVGVTKPALFYSLTTIAALFVLIIALGFFANNLTQLFPTPTSEVALDTSQTPEPEVTSTLSSENISPSSTDSETPTVTYTLSITPLSETDIRGTSRVEIYATISQEALVATTTHSYLLSLTPPTATPLMAITVNELLDVMESGQFRLLIGYNRLSPSSRYLAIVGHGVYTVSDGQQLFSLGATSGATSEFTPPIFSPNETYVALSGDGVYRLADGQKLFSIGAADPEPTFSTDESYLAITGDGLYQLPDGEKLFSIPTGNRNHNIETSFSPDESYLAIAGDSVYRLPDGERLFAIGGEYSVFYPDNNYLLVDDDGVYQLPGGQKLFSRNRLFFGFDWHGLIVPGDGVYRVSDFQKIYDIGGSEESLIGFNEDGTYMVIVGDGVYRASDGQKLFDIGGSDVGFYLIHESFTEAGDYMVVPTDGVYSIRERRKLFDISADGFYPRFSADGSYLAIAEDGVYSVSSGQKLFNIGGLAFSTIEFTADGRYMFVSDDGIYRISDGYYYGYDVMPLDVPSNIFKVSYNVTLIIDPTQNVEIVRVSANNEINMHSEPNLDSPIVTFFEPNTTLFALSYSDSWYQVVSNYGYTGWVSETVVVPYRP